MYKFWSISIFLLVGIVNSSFATHLRAGEITVRRENCSSLTFIITVTVYTDTQSPVKFGGPQADGLDVLDFGDGSERFIIPETPNTIRNDLGANIGIASYTVVHTYRGAGRYTISYREPNRNNGVLNMINSVDTRFYIETEIRIDGIVGCNNTPILLIAPVDRGCVGVAFQHNPGAYDPDGDSLSYELVVPFQDRSTTVNGYRGPNDRSFYVGDYNASNEQKNGPPAFKINQVTGTITWDAPGTQGEYNIAFVVIEWRRIKLPGTDRFEWLKLGFVRRDMQIIIEDCKNERPDLIIPKDTCVVAGTTLKAIILGLDPDKDNVKIEAFSEIFGETFISRATVNPPSPGISLPTSPKPAELKFEWKTVCDHVKDQQYQIVFKVIDSGRPNLVTFKTWFVKVVGPAPDIKTADVNLAKRHVNVTWTKYECENASAVQIWRKVDATAFTPSNCETGIPPSLGFVKIGEVDATVTSFKDTNNGKGLSVGAKYCYRLVAVYPLPRGGESYVSKEICIDPILASAPIVTHVTVQKTDEANGQLRISWRRPFEIDKVQFPPPYKFKVWRSETFTGAKPFTAAHSGIIDDTTFVDDGINTKDKTFSYLIELHSKTKEVSTYQPIDSSSAASMVRLEVKSQAKKLELNWTAFVPWSNQSQLYPRHLIYRGLQGTPEANLVLIDSVNVITSGLTYTDIGKYNNEPLAEDKIYCYRVVTRGTYGNPKIKAPQINYSQMVCAQPSDLEPPTCIPVVQLADVISCEDYVANELTCGLNTFSNKLVWKRPTAAECGGEILGYRIYASATPGGEYALVQLPDNATYVRDTFYIDNGLTSFAKCYKISVIDRSGNESPLSNSICNDNCPYYELPNVFTPNGDNCNDLFSAYSNRDLTGETPGSSIKCKLVEKARCTRFAKKVVFKVFNRWGRKVYEYESFEGDLTRNIYIDWNGKDNNDQELPSGIYYYSAEVTFDSIDPAKRNQTIKGWVHLMR